jgi:hypothetical protein
MHLSDASCSQPEINETNQTEIAQSFKQKQRLALPERRNSPPSTEFQTNGEFGFEYRKDGVEPCRKTMKLAVLEN